eukprot:gnl/Spiro4/29631_TR14530_c1_g1_i1.p1 gnl/Spiro4/29631_TR14530_c1_g1~~gnl/Spiro4/29631_TR14530_c1_g1_i1.p1  ORF type:complete len:857 (-),score=214.11 gnl/Spiro4/29631_TR14530_c1_g1_i1:17-2587(-)
MRGFRDLGVGTSYRKSLVDPDTPGPGTYELPAAGDVHKSSKGATFTQARRELLDAEKDQAIVPVARRPGGAANTPLNSTRSSSPRQRDLYQSVPSSGYGRASSPRSRPTSAASRSSATQLMPCLRSSSPLPSSRRSPSPTSVASSSSATNSSPTTPRSPVKRQSSGGIMGATRSSSPQSPRPLSSPMRNRNDTTTNPHKEARSSPSPSKPTPSSSSSFSSSSSSSSSSAAAGSKTSPAPTQLPATRQFPSFRYDSKFEWNHHLQEPLVRHTSNPKWRLRMIHGYFAQCLVPIGAKTIKIILIARRSRFYAGARFLKRGICEEGFVANDVECEQIVADCTPGIQQHGGYTSFLQMRGSMPMFWSQDPSVLIPKPVITLYRPDPTYSATTLHFAELFARYGAPILCVNLAQEQGREGIASLEYKAAIEYLNKFLPEIYIKFFIFDFKKNKDEHNGCVEKAFECMYRQRTNLIYETGFFQLGRKVQLQRGVLRTNCIDCIDRTNIAQSFNAYMAFNEQLYALGAIAAPNIDLQAPIIKVLLNHFEEMGDILAVQYGGSFAHKTNMIDGRNTPKTLDFFTTLRRYYNSSFTDSGKQDAINLFLGCFVPANSPKSIWELPSDYYLHHNPNSRRALLSWHLGAQHSFWWKEPLTSFDRAHPMPPFPVTCDYVAMAAAITDPPAEQTTADATHWTSFDRVLACVGERLVDREVGAQSSGHSHARPAAAPPTGGSNYDPSVLVELTEDTQGADDAQETFEEYRVPEESCVRYGRYELGQCEIYSSEEMQKVYEYHLDEAQHLPDYQTVDPAIMNSLAVCGDLAEEDPVYEEEMRLVYERYYNLGQDAIWQYEDEDDDPEYVPDQ